MVELFTAKQLKSRFPWLNTEDVALASYGNEPSYRNPFYATLYFIHYFKWYAYSCITKYVQLNFQQ